MQIRSPLNLISPLCLSIAHLCDCDRPSGLLCRIVESAQKVAVERGVDIITILNADISQATARQFLIDTLTTAGIKMS